MRCYSVGLAFASAARSTLSPGLLLALDIEERKRPHRLALAARMQACGTLRGSRHPRRCGAPRSACRADGRRARPRTRTPPRPPRARVGEIGRAEVGRGDAAPACRSRARGRPRSPRRSAPASTSRATATPRKPPRNAARALPSSVAGIGVREHEGAGHRPFARLGRALEHERVRRIEPDGAQQLHWLVGPPVAGSSHDGCASAGSERAPLGARALAGAPHQQIAVVVDVAAHAASPGVRAARR